MMTNGMTKATTPTVNSTYVNACRGLGVAIPAAVCLRFFGDTTLVDGFSQHSFACFRHVVLSILGAEYSELHERESAMTTNSTYDPAEAVPYLPKPNWLYTK